MTEYIGAWVVRVICTAFLMAVAAALTPRGAVKRIALFCCSLLLLLAVFRPLLGEAPLRAAEEFSYWQDDILSRTEALEEENQKTWEALIEEELASYIEAKAEGLAFPCEVAVTVETGEDGVPRPRRVEITAAGKNEALGRFLREELGLAQEDILWRET
ncbi:MAG: hypothetical protein ACI3W8_02580 [Oscillospiraceae bacterium]